MQNADSIKNIAVLSGGINSIKSNRPTQYSNRQKQYFSQETSLFKQNNAKYASDFFVAQVQGLNAQDPTEWTQAKLRMSDIVRPSATTDKLIDDYKVVLFQSASIDYFPIGSKIVAMGSTWLCTNPANISSVLGSGIVQRCNATWNYLDFYGNVCQEPIAIEQKLAKSSTPDFQDFTLITKGYFDIKCQYNAQTAQLLENSRIILGNAAYALSGLSNFLEEFTGDHNSVRLMEFTARYEEPNYEIDDMENRVAGGLTFHWEIVVDGAQSMYAGNTTQFSASSIRNGQAVESTSANPISYVWSSSNTEIATVDALGNVRVVAPGTCNIICTLGENSAIQTLYPLTVEESDAGASIGFAQTVPQQMRPYESTTITAECYMNGQQTEGTVTWTFDGAAAGAYTTSTNGNTLTLTCWNGSSAPLFITASWSGATAQCTIRLLGI